MLWLHSRLVLRNIRSGLRRVLVTSIVAFFNTKEKLNMGNNDDLQIRLRKNQNTLVAVGWGVIVFGIWSVIKGVLVTAFNTETLAEVSEQGTPAVLMFWAILAVFLAIDLWLRLYVGLSAINEGKGKKKRWGYIILALFMALFGFALLVVTVVLIGRNEEESMMRAIVSIVVDLTSGITFVEMAVSAIKVKRLERMLARGER